VHRPSGLGGGASVGERQRDSSAEAADGPLGQRTDAERPATDSSRSSPFESHLAKRFTLDARSLALGRIAVAALLLVDLAGRANDLEAHYTDLGVLPRSAFRLGDAGLAWSLHVLGGSVPFEGALFVLAWLSAVALLVGYRTFWATLACLVLTISLHARNPLLRDGQDDLVRVLLFWCVFLPLGARMSLDEREGRPSHPFERQASAGDAVYSPATVGLVLQLVIVYLSAAAAKGLSEWWRDGDGLAFAISLGRYQTLIAQWALGFPRALRAMNFAVILGEAGLPLLFLAFVRIRAWIVFAFVVLHAGFALFLRLGIFPAMSVAGWLFTVPAGVWERLRVPTVTGEAVPAPGRKTTMALAAAVTALVVATNVEQLGARFPGGRSLDRALSAIGLNQWWLVFAPQTRAATRPDGWWVDVGTRADGSTVDLARGGAPSFARPESIPDTFPNRRWRHYVANMTLLLITPPPGSMLDVTRQAYGHWLCREARESGGPPLARAAVYFVHHAPRVEGPAHVFKVVEVECGK
jgi:hypothetical protein